jgi:chromosome segregation ATPase
MSLNNNINLTNNKILSSQNYKYTFNNSNNFKNLDIKEKNITLLKEKIKNQEKNINYLNTRLMNYDDAINEIARLNQEIKRLNEIINYKNNLIFEFQNATDLSKIKIEQIKHKYSKYDELMKVINVLHEEKNKLNNIIKEKTGEIINIINDCNNLKNELIHFKNEYEKRIDDLSKDNEELKKNNWILIGQIKEKNIKIKEMESIIGNLRKELNSNKNNIVKRNLTNYISYNNKSKIKSHNNKSYSFNNIENSMDSHAFNNTSNANSKTNRRILKLKNMDYLYNLEKGKKNRGIIFHKLNNNKINNFSRDKTKYGLNNTFDSPLKYNDLIIDKCMNLHNRINLKNNI